MHRPTAANFGLNGTSNFTHTAGGLFNLTRSSSAPTGGIFTNAPLSLTSANVIDLNNGKFYINIHTASNGGGEMRGFIVQTPSLPDAHPRPGHFRCGGRKSNFLL